MKKSIFVTGLLILSILFFHSCNNAPNNGADQLRQAETEMVVQQAEKVVGMPNIKNFTEMKMRKFTYELCDNPRLKTFTYLLDQNGKLHFLCNSIGHGVPYSSRMSNPEKLINTTSNHNDQETLPQAEPNGLFEPEFADATWVLAVDEASGLISPMLVEFPIIVSQFPLRYDSDFRPDTVIATKEHVETHEKIQDFLGVQDGKLHPVTKEKK